MTRNFKADVPSSPSNPGSEPRTPRRSSANTGGTTSKPGGEHPSLPKAYSATRDQTDVAGKAELLPPGTAAAPAGDTGPARETGTVADVESIARGRGSQARQGRRTTNTSSTFRENAMRRQQPPPQDSTRTRTSRGTFASVAGPVADDRTCAPRATSLLGLVGGAGIG